MPPRRHWRGVGPANRAGGGSFSPTGFPAGSGWGWRVEGYCEYRGGGWDAVVANWPFVLATVLAVGLPAGVTMGRQVWSAYEAKFREAGEGGNEVCRPG